MIELSYRNMEVSLMDGYRIVNEPDEGKFFVVTESGERLGEMEYVLKDGLITVLHTNLEPVLQGTGMGQKLVDFIADYARENNFKVNASCFYARKVLAKHADKYADILGPEVDAIL
jgi:hypothetical protein